MDDNTDRRYRSDFYNPVFSQHRVIDATPRGESEPLLFRLTITKDTNWGSSRKSVILVFFDTAGENLNKRDTMSVVNKYIYRSHGIILLIDALQLRKVRRKLLNRGRKKDDLPNENAETSDILARTTDLIQNGQQLRDRDKIPIPIAVAFSKFDAVRDIVGGQYLVKGNARHEGGFDLVDATAVNDEMMQLLGDWGEPDVVNQVKAYYKQGRFFGLSALGCNPHDSKAKGEIRGVTPQRVEDPFLWLLYVNGLLGAR